MITCHAGKDTRRIPGNGETASQDSSGSGRRVRLGRKGYRFSSDPVTPACTYPPP